MVHIKNVEEILKISERHETPNLLACKYIRKNVDNMIRSRAVNHTYITFEIPAMIVSNPHYDREKVTKRIASHYTKIGFKCTVEDFNIDISWDLSEGNKEDSDSESEEEEIQDESEEENEQSEEEEKETKKVILKNPQSLKIRVSDIKTKNKN